MFCFVLFSFLFSETLYLPRFVWKIKSLHCAELQEKIIIRYFEVRQVQGTRQIRICQNALQPRITKRKIPEHTPRPLKHPTKLFLAKLDLIDNVFHSKSIPGYMYFDQTMSSSLQACKDQMHGKHFFCFRYTVVLAVCGCS